MNLVTFSITYIEWHYTRAIRNLLAAESNILAFLLNFFSIPVLAATLFTPWRRLGEERNKQGFDLEDLATVIVVNTLMRIVGFIIRFITITVGLVVLALALVVSFVLLVLWLLWPLVSFALFVNGLYFILI